MENMTNGTPATKKDSDRIFHRENYSVWTVLGWAIFSASGLMIAALVVQMLDHSIVNATKDVLPLATALVGFAGGAVTAIFGKEVSEANKKNQG
jgi:hypothetical protein